VKTIHDLFETIMSIPHVDIDTKVRAGYLRSQFGHGSGFYLFNMFGL
jgi:hypothetical protein